MKDLNFFDAYIEKREFKFNKMILLYVLLVVSIIGITAYGIYNQLFINSLRNEVADRKIIVEDPKMVKKVEEIKALQTEVNTFKEEVNKIVDLDSSIEAMNLIGEELLKEIKIRMPEELFLSNFSAYDREIQISGISKDTYSIAEFQKGLEMLEESEAIFISNITNTEDYYSFIMNLTLKEVEMDGNESNQE